jgi:hypothetical protein
VFCFLPMILCVFYFSHSPLKFGHIETPCSYRKLSPLSPLFSRQGETLNVGNLINSQG